MTLDLTIAIPVRNDTGHLIQLLASLAALDLARQVIVADDGSDEPVAAAALARASGFPAERLAVLRLDRGRGAGAARNLALRAVRTRHLLFLDADDRPTRELRSLCAALAQAGEFDFCIFQHHDSRLAKDRLFGQPCHDQAFWAAAGLARGALAPVSDAAAAQLAQTANYPWNKIYRTEFLHAQGITCTEISVHNDVELHWMSFLKAGRILASDHIGVVHFVDEAGQRLTNRFGPERLQVFQAFEAVAQEIRRAPERGLGLPFYAFTLGLIGWIRDRMQPGLHPRLAASAAGFLEHNRTAAQRAELRRLQPEAYERILHLIAAHAPANLPGLLEAPAAERRRA
ncbi:glycosyltransferase [Leisingera aquaemixtae]|uniref:glycosyltransferase family 2 protein n=1 Tax=Leisingera aquaemixtae TaxID=1396826 RepID=UPI001C96C971|nr:glycosyltransferase [Leisingera aquaemixtae]MBY6069083.1 glycosyltransferase [Leisingera aquaemixtae]